MRSQHAPSPEPTAARDADLRERADRDRILNIVEVAKLLRVPVSWVYERARRRSFDRIPHFKLGKYLRFSEKEILDWLERIKGI
jgi:excisionase family DNA binding protein